MDLSTTYMGLELRNPIVPSSSPLTADFDKCRQLEDAGAGAIVCHSLFEEEFLHESHEMSHYMQHGTESFAESLTYFPDMTDEYLGPEGYLEHIRKLKEALEIPVIGSLNGITTGGWIQHAQQIEEAGADGLELNVYYIATDLSIPSSEVEQLYLDILAAVKKHVKIPVAMKLSPYFSSMADMARRLNEAGADALVLFNRFYQPSIDLDALEVIPDLVLSTPFAGRLPLRWIAILYGRIRSDLAATSGIHTHLDVLRMLMAGAKITMTASALLLNGIGYLGTMLKDLEEWMVEQEYTSVGQMQGSMSQMAIADPAAFERANYIKTLHSWK
ncbi:dihydroorotate dehydrogenase-like protein [Gemmatimonadota bacterium]